MRWLAVWRVPRPWGVFLAAALVLGPGSCSKRDDGRKKGAGNRPVVIQVAPLVGTTTGGESVAIFTRNFEDDFLVDPPVVFFGGVVSPSVTAASPTDLLVIAPPGMAPGAVDVTVEATAVLESARCKGCFEYVAPPPCRITGVVPSTGVVAGGEQVTIFGTDFGPPGAASVRVLFGAIASPSVIRIGPEELQAVTPPASAFQPGFVDLTVVLPGGPTCDFPNAFEYVLASCTVDRVVPDEGFLPGGETITVVGAGFDASPQVLLGGVPATNVSVDAARERITCTTPPGAAPGFVPVSVMGATASCDLADAFRYIPVGGCSIDGILPPAGSVAGGEAVTILGSGFELAPPPVVEFVKGGAPVAAQAVTALDSRTLDAVTPAWPAAEKVDIVVTNPTSGLSCTLVDGFEFVGAGQCAIIGVTPPTGSISGGDVVTIQGYGLDPIPLDIQFGGISALGITWLSSTAVEVVTPPGVALGTVDVRYVNPGPTACVLTGGFTYVLPSCTITAVNPVQGPRTGPTPVEILGSGFPASGRVYFGTTEANPNLTVSTPTRITTYVPGGVTPGCVDVCVVGISDPVSCCLVDGYCYVGSCAITAVSPSTGALVGGETITIQGTAFDPVASVLFGGVFSPQVTVISPTEIQALAPSSPSPGAVDVLVIGTNGSTCVSAGAYTYQAGPGGGGCTIGSITPTQGASQGGTVVTVSGTGFDSGPPPPGILFGKRLASSVVVLGPTQITCIAPPAVQAGFVDVTVVNSNGDVCTLADGFEYLAPPPCGTGCNMTSIVPDTGPVAGGNLVAIHGMDFCPGIQVWFGAESRTISSFTPTQLVVNVPPGALPGPVTVFLMQPNGAACFLTDAYTYF